MLKGEESHSVLTVLFVASQWISGLKEDRTEHLLTAQGLIPFLSLFAKYPCLLSYLRGVQWSRESAPTAYSGKVPIK